jgi:phosphomannomutase
VWIHREVIIQIIRVDGRWSGKTILWTQRTFSTQSRAFKEHLTDISELVVKEKADLGVVVDPDVDRLAFICEDGEMFGEEYTLVACADYVLSKTREHGI